MLSLNLDEKLSLIGMIPSLDLCFVRSVVME